MVIPLTELTEVFFLILFFLQSPLHLVGTQQPMAPLRVRYKCREWKLCSTDLSLPAHAGWMNHWAASLSHISRQVLYLQSSWFQLSVLHIVLCQTSAVVPVLLPWLPTSQCFNPSSPAAFIICGSVIHRLCKSDTLNSPTKHSGQKAAVSGNPA